MLHAGPRICTHSQASSPPPEKVGGLHHR